ncbi:hypothetical protein F511_43591 [Dorcoceras hygrometricum]|uniref:Uncharacterized protein n=1 Tax=Dorcoceras hygrometricum TaxID=472368 RepID=A0A2Z7DAG2_9LAMI|nr:hypothetical protein F511_43591 [Dorcoceras hygrometricum]
MSTLVNSFGSMIVGVREATVNASFRCVLRDLMCIIDGAFRCHLYDVVWVSARELALTLESGGFKRWLRNLFGAI